MRMRRATSILLLLLILSLLTPLSLVAAQEQGVTVVDDFGREVLIPHEPRRIVSIAPSITETLFALGLGDRVVGVTRYCNYPPEVLEKVGKGEITVIGGYTDPSLEKIVGLNPDLVIGHNLLKPELVKKIEDAGIPIIIVKTSETIQGVYDDIRLIGKACWADDAASKLVEKLRSEIAFWEERVEGVEKVDVAEIAWVNPLWVAGNGTYIHDIIEHAGGGQELIYEGVMEMKRKGLIHGEVIPIDPDIISRPGPRVGILFEMVVKALHSEVWSKVYEVEDLIAPRRATVGDLVTIYALVRNPGMVAGEKLVELCVDGEILSETVKLGPGEERLLNFTFVVERKGMYEVRLKSLSRSIEVSPTSEEVMEKARKSIEESMRSYVDEVISPISSRLDSVASDVSSLKQDLSKLESSTSSEIAKLSGEVSELGEQIGSLNNLAVASIILSIIALIISLASMAYAYHKVKRA
ncbi:MAG: hypothetical protein B6U65_02870 [Candidatus Wolframiiraptor sp. EX4484-121]|nr:MAG: hypothetical protein B6U65_02870 [Candidatus Wolframiiraptor sp. EX4484-121]